MRLPPTGRQRRLCPVLLFYVDININCCMLDCAELSYEVTREVREACICLHLQQAARAVARRFDAALRPLGLTNGQFSLLMSLNRPAAPTIGNVSAAGDGPHHADRKPQAARETRAGRGRHRRGRQARPPSGPHRFRAGAAGRRGPGMAADARGHRSRDAQRTRPGCVPICAPSPSRYKSQNTSPSAAITAPLSTSP